MHFLPVTMEEMSMQEAVKTGATALFGEKYGDTVRVVSIGEFSKELCGGTHVANSGLIGSFKIVSESGVAAGVRRIEAITGLGVVNKLKETEEIIDNASDILKTSHAGLITKISSVSEEVRTLKRELEELKKSAISSSLDSILSEAKTVGDIKLLTKAFKDYDINDLRQISDDIKKSNKGYILVFATENGEKVTFMVSVTDDLLEKGYHAGNMIKQIAAAAGGGGGGKADMAQAGAKDPSKIQDAFKVAESLIK
ncbi:Alanine--tRNA ligase [bioreactor metagenome]|uniref:Alanine--tRNA ligase n=1 Tax=bioreactor metagenome TaxID=1076179 RepID=A0A645F1L2_9ZZZZ